MSEQNRVLPGDPAPWFTARASTNPRYQLESAAGNYLVLTFVNSGAIDRATITAIRQSADAFDDANARWFIVTPDPADEAPGALPLRLPGIRAFFDRDSAIRKLYGIDAYGQQPVSVVVSPRLQVIGIINESDPAGHARLVMAVLGAQPRVDRLVEALGPPPILVIPDVFERALCRLLIEGYEKHGGEPSGFMRDEAGMTVRRFDDSFKVRRDWEITDPQLQNAIGARFQRRVVPEVQKAYNFQVTHMERHIVSCYDAKEGGHFNSHRDNTAIGTAHRRFACTVNLNTEDYKGGDLRFPEFGPQLYRAPTGGCVIFSCALLHQATKVTEGKRYAFLPFLHDAAAEKVREQNRKFLDLPEEKSREAGAGP
jgi:hypothetical protein